MKKSREKHPTDIFLIDVNKKTQIALNIDGRGWNS